MTLLSSYYIKDKDISSFTNPSRDFYMKVISAKTPNGYFSSEYNFGRLEYVNGYQNSVNCISFRDTLSPENNLPKNTCYLFTGMLLANCPIYLENGKSYHVNAQGDGLRNETGGWLIRYGIETDHSNTCVNVGNSSRQLSLYSQGRNISINGSDTTFVATTNSTSDKRLKDHVSDMSDMESFFMDLKPSCFKFHSDLYDRADRKQPLKWGFYAQNILSAFKNNGMDWHDYEVVVKEMTDISQEERKYIDGTCDGILKVNYQEFTALNTKMIQNVYQKTYGLQECMLSLQGQLLSLRGENAILKQRLDRLEELLSA